MRRPIRVAMLVGAAGALTVGGTTAALAALGGSQQTQTSTSYSAPSNASPASTPGAAGKVTADSAASTASPASAPAAAGKITADRARQIAQHRVPGSKVTETEFDHEHGRAVWEVDLTRQHRDYEVHIDAATGNIRSVHHDTDMSVHHDTDMGDDD